MHLPPHAAVYGAAATAFGVANGVVHIAADAFLDTATLRALVIALATTTMAGVFGIIVAVIQRNSDRETHARLDALERRGADIAGAVGATKRSTDPDATSSPPSSEARA